MNKSIFTGLIAVLILGLMSSCSKSGNLYDCVPADAMLVMSGSPEATLLNSGCVATTDGFEVSEAINKLMGASFSANDSGGFKDFLNGSGVDFKRAVTVVDPANDRYFVTFMLDDESSFCKWCEKQNFKAYGSEGYSVYSPQRGVSIAVKDSRGCLIFGCAEGKEPEFVDALHEAAKAAPLPSWIEDKISEAPALGIALNIEKHIGFLASRDIMNFTLPVGNPSLLGYNAEALTHGYFVYDCTLDGVAARGKGAFYTADGEKIVNRAKIRPVNTALLRYAKDDDAVMMISLPDSVDWHQTWTQINESLTQAGAGMDAHMITMAASVFENIDHTAMLSGRVTDMAALDSPQGWSGTIAIDFREGKAYEYSELIRTMADSFGLAPRNDDDGSFSVIIPDSGLAVHIKVEGNTLIASSSPIQAANGKASFARAFDNMRGGLVLDIPKDNVLAQFVSMPFGINISYTASAEEIVFDITQTSAQGMLIDNFIKYFADRTVN